jgi:hypothetical protein
MDDPLVALGIGKKQLIKNWLDEMGVEHYVINEDLTIDVKGSVDFISKHPFLGQQFPDYIQFYKVYENFYCNDNNLTSLRGCPRYVGNWFSCESNELTSLNGCPIKVGAQFYCRGNKTEFTIMDVLELCEVREDYIFC